SGRDRLVELLEGDPTLVTELRMQLMVSGALARSRPELSDETFLRSALPHLKTVGEEAEEIFPGKVMTAIRFRRARRAVLAMAAVIALSGTVFFLSTGRKSGGGVTATLYSGEESGESREVRSGETLEFSKGVSRLEFQNGAVVAVEAPASLLVRSPEEVLLHHGRLNAWCPETAHGFRVVTTSATLTDRGTSFGVSAEADGTADFVVLDGKVEVEKDGETRTLLEGGAVRANSQKGLRDLAFEPSPYQRTWPVASGIRTTRGEVIPAPPGTPETLAGLESDKHILVIPERRDFTLTSRIRVDITAPGTYHGNNLLANLPFGDRPAVKMRSYLLRYNPVGSLPKPGFRRFEGSVTFDRPVLAIIAGGKKLHQSDKLLSNSPLPALNPIDAGLRGLERGKNRDSDKVTLSQDRRTVTVIFYAGESIDEIRAITADD
ncbi:MAG: hypothetical protein EOP87_20915, partial [Verrucomicrobiaceae bacterium]